MGALTIYPLVELMDAVGWWTTLVLVAIAVWVVGGLTVTVLCQALAHYGLRPDGDAADADPPVAPATSEVAPPPDAETHGVGVTEALRSPAFWFILAATIIFGFSKLGWVVLQFPALLDKGFSTTLAALAVSMYGADSVTARLGVSWYADRIGGQRVFRAAFLFMGIGLAIFAAAGSFTELLPFYLFFALGDAMYIVTRQTMVPDYFGTYRFASIRGWMGTISSITGAMGPVMGALVFDRAGSYTLAFMVFAAVLLMGVLAAFLAIRYRPVLAPASVPAAG